MAKMTKKKVKRAALSANEVGILVEELSRKLMDGNVRVMTLSVVTNGGENVFRGDGTPSDMISLMEVNKMHIVTDHFSTPLRGA